jgi:hypothetical protein
MGQEERSKETERWVWDDLIEGLAVVHGTIPVVYNIV